jgi:hypothetical protein
MPYCANISLPVAQINVLSKWEVYLKTFTVFQHRIDQANVQRLTEWSFPPYFLNTKKKTVQINRRLYLRD